MRKCRKKAQSAGGLRFEILELSQSLEALLDSIFVIEFNSWKGRNGTAILCQPETVDFYKRLAHWVQEHGHLTIYLMRLNETPIASVYCLKNGQTVFGIKAGYDDSLGSISPGNLLYQDMFELLFNSSGGFYENNPLIVLGEDGMEGVIGVNDGNSAPDNNIKELNKLFYAPVSEAFEWSHQIQGYPQVSLSSERCHRYGHYEA